MVFSEPERLAFVPAQALKPNKRSYETLCNPIGKARVGANLNILGVIISYTNKWVASCAS
jgi:uncharacterized metal-binding protein